MIAIISRQILIDKNEIFFLKNILTS